MATRSGLMNKRIPTLLGVFILIGGLIAGIILVNSRQGLGAKAGPTEAPKNVQISNRSSSTFSVSWTTDNPLTGLIRYSQDPTKLTTPAGDVRDQISGTSNEYTNHEVNVTGLDPGTDYYFVIVSGSGVYDDTGKPFVVRTTAQVIQPPEDVIFGKVVTATGDPVNGGIVFAEVEGGNNLSTITKADGTWRLNLASSLDNQDKVLTYNPTTAILSIFIQAGSAGTATAISNTSKDKPVPDIVLGKNQSFVEGVATSALETTATSSGGLGFQSQLTLSEQIEATSSVKILNPAVNGELVNTTTPLFRGKSLPGQTLNLSVITPSMTTTLTGDANGDWSWTAPQALSPGSDSLTVSFSDANGNSQQITRTFTVAAPGTASLPAFTATPSATITATPSATPIIIATTMPATESANLTSSGGLTTSLGLAILGIVLLLMGRVSKKIFER